jgi:hypothetical protein
VLLQEVLEEAEEAEPVLRLLLQGVLEGEGAVLRMPLRLPVKRNLSVF